MNRKRILILAIAAALLVLLIVACGPAAAPTAKAGDTPMPAPTRVPQLGARDEEGIVNMELSYAGSESAGTAANQPAEDKRMVITTSQLSIVVEDVEVTLPKVLEMIKQMGGYIVDSKSYRTYSDRLAATVTLRVPSARFDEAMAQLRGLATKVQSEAVAGRDVTSEYVDLQARLTALQATEKELLGLLAEVRQSGGNAQQKAQAILDIYTRLTDIRSQIEQIQGQMKYMEEMSAMATITVELLPREPETVRPVVEEGFNLLRMLSDAGRTLVETLGVLLNGLIWFVVVVLPIAAIFIVPAGLIVWWFRRHRKQAKQA